MMRTRMRSPGERTWRARASKLVLLVRCLLENGGEDAEEQAHKAIDWAWRMHACKYALAGFASTSSFGWKQTTQSYKQYARRILMSCKGRSFESVGMRPKWFIVFIPSLTRPKIVCFPTPHRLHRIRPSNHGVGANVMKNWHPFVLGPEFAYTHTNSEFKPSPKFQRP